MFLPASGEPYVFVMFGDHDAGKIELELERLTSWGCRLWYDMGVAPGKEWIAELVRAINQCALVLVYLSPSATRSFHFRRELRWAVRQRKKLVVVELEKISLPEELLALDTVVCRIKAHELDAGEYERRLSSALPPEVRGSVPRPFVRVGIFGLEGSGKTSLIRAFASPPGNEVTVRGVNTKIEAFEVTHTRVLDVDVSWVEFSGATGEPSKLNLEKALDEVEKFETSVERGNRTTHANGLHAAAFVANLNDPRKFDESLELFDTLLEKFRRRPPKTLAVLFTGADPEIPGGPPKAVYRVRAAKLRQQFEQKAGDFQVEFQVTSALDQTSAKAAMSSLVTRTLPGVVMTSVFLDDACLLLQSPGAIVTNEKGFVFGTYFEPGASEKAGRSLFNALGDLLAGGGPVPELVTIPVSKKWEVAVHAFQVREETCFFAVLLSPGVARGNVVMRSRIETAVRALRRLLQNL